jgi:hypothetical protein
MWDTAIEISRGREKSASILLAEMLSPAPKCPELHLLSESVADQISHRFTVLLPRTDSD